jgi:hypothetical protein
MRVGRIGTVHAYGAGGAYNGLASFTYDYDDLDRLTLVHNGSDPALHQSFSYDAAHNMTKNSALPGGSNLPDGSNYGYPVPVNCPPPRTGLCTVQPHAVKQAGPYALSYDANGNRLTKSGGAISQSITWDGENRPSAITEGATVNLFVYGPDGSRLKKRAPNGHADRVFPICAHLVCR